MKIHRVRALVGAITLLLTAVAGAPADIARAQVRTAVLVVRSAASPIAPDAVVRDRLIALGFDVVLVDDNNATPGDADGADVLVISMSIKASLVNSKYTDAATPILVWEPYLYDDLGFHAGGKSGQTSSTTKVTIVDPTHPIVAGYTGEVRATDSKVPTTWGRPVGDVDIIAAEPFNAARPVIFAYEAGAQMNVATAPARRVGFFSTQTTPTVWNSDGVTLFDNAIAWLTSGEPPPNAAPVVGAGDDVIVAPGVPIALNGVASDDGRPADDLTVSWTGPSGVSFDDASSPTTTATLPGVGTYELFLTANDTEFVTVDSVVVTVSADAPPPAPEVLWVTSGASAPSVERPGIERLEAAGMNVTVADDDTADADDATGKDLVIITSRVSPAKVKAKFAAVEVPVLIWEAFLYDDMGFAGSGGARGQATGQRSIRIVGDGPLAAGLSDVHSVLTKNQTMSYAVPSGDATIIVRVTSSSNRATIFAYDVGDEMLSGTAPARCLGFFLGGGGPKPLNETGWSLWDAAVEWLLAEVGPPAVPPVAVASASATTVDAGADVTFDGSASTDDADAITSYAWAFGDGTSAIGAVVTHAYGTAGTYDATLTVTDIDGATDSDTVRIEVTEVWPGGTRPFRTTVTVAAGVHNRSDDIAVIDIDFGSLLGSLGSTDPTLDPASIPVVATAGDAVVDFDVPFQFEPTAGFDPTSNASGELIVAIKGSVPSGSTRTFDVYFDTAGRGGYSISTFVDAVVTSNAVDENRSTTRFATASGDWYFDMEGGGFTSLDDVGGRDWISWNSASGSNGEFRGIPNAVFPEGWFHPGGSGIVSRVVSDGPLRPTVESTSPNGQYMTRWHVYPSHAEMQMVRAGGEDWFLYEGTPGGVFNGNGDRVWRPNGTSKLLRYSFNGDIADEE